jgi:hypothetical protein
MAGTITRKTKGKAKERLKDMQLTRTNEGRVAPSRGRRLHKHLDDNFQSFMALGQCRNQSARQRNDKRAQR